MRMIASKPTRRNEPTRAAYSELVEGRVSGASRGCRRGGGVSTSFPGRITHMFKRPRNGTGIFADFQEALYPHEVNHYDRRCRPHVKSLDELCVTEEDGGGIMEGTLRTIGVIIDDLLQGCHCEAWFCSGHP